MYIWISVEQQIQINIDLNKRMFVRSKQQSKD